MILIDPDDSENEDSDDYEDHFGPLNPIKDFYKI